MSDKQLTDEEVAAGLSRDDPEVLEWVCNRWAKWLLYENSALLRSRDASRLIADYRAAADDVTQEVFMRFWRSRHSYDPQKGSVSTYLMSIARGVVFDTLTEERERRRAERGDDSGPAPPVNAPLTPEMLERFAKCFAALSAERQVVLLLWATDLSFEEIREQTESFTGERKTVGNLRVIKHRAHEALMRCLGIET